MFLQFSKIWNDAFNSVKKYEHFAFQKLNVKATIGYTWSVPDFWHVVIGANTCNETSAKEGGIILKLRIHSS